MKNFYSQPDCALFDSHNYLSQWIEQWTSVDTTSQTTLQSRASHISNLWAQFNLNKSSLDKYYMDDAKNIQSYMYSFLIPNIERMYFLLCKPEIKNQIFNLLNLFFNTEEPQENATSSIPSNKKDRKFVVTDFGCGPLSATVAFLCLLNLFALNSNITLEIQIYAVERSERIYETGLKLIQSSLSDRLKINFERLTSIEKQPEKSHLILSSNVLNEIAEKHRIKIMGHFYNHLHDDGCLLILEPGQEMVSKSLAGLRDEFLTKYIHKVQIISPCPHQYLCPLGPNSPRKDWCWFYHRWDPPKELKQIDSKTKIDHHVLNLFYLFFKKTKEKNEVSYSRVVSDPIPLKMNETLFKLLFCNTNGQIEDVIRSEKKDMLGRGDISE